MTELADAFARIPFLADIERLVAQGVVRLPDAK